MFFKPKHQLHLDKKFYLLIISFLALHLSFGQSGTWTWVSGDSTANSYGVYGTQGTSSVTNHPPAVYEPLEWMDKEGNFWLYGGLGFHGIYSDLWKYNPLNNEWTWIKGDTSYDTPPVYGVKGTPASGNTPGRRYFTASTWVDTSGNFWLFGGTNCGSDLWKYTIASNQWTWVKGDSTPQSPGIYGNKGVPDPANNPGTRDETCTAWTDSSGDLWLFGGFGYDKNGTVGSLNDLFRYNIQSNEWTWMKGSSTVGAFASYGIQGVSNPANDPGARLSYTKWKSNKGNLWLMGGELRNITGFRSLNDLWKYNIYDNNWTWMLGPDTIVNGGIYNSTCSESLVNLPRSRMEQRSSTTDNCGRFWMFGGEHEQNTGGNNIYFLNDLWVFDPLQLKWKWLSGTNVPNQTGTHGTKNVPSTFNMPGSRCGAVSWWSTENKYYVFGGIMNTNWDSYSDLWVYTPDTSCISFTNCSQVVAPPPVANFQADSTIICAYDCIHLANLSTNSTSYQWKFPGGLPSTSTDPNPMVCYQNSGIYTITLIAVNSAGRDTLVINNYITVNPAPVIVNIFQPNDSVIYCNADTGFKSYQWYKDSVPIHGATDSVLIITEGGNYNVIVTNSYGCSLAGGINIVGLKSFTNDLIIRIYPDPVKTSLLFSVSSKLSEKEMKLNIYNVIGQSLHQSSIQTDHAGYTSYVVDVSSLPPGLYFIQLTVDAKQSVKSWFLKFVKE